MSSKPTSQEIALNQANIDGTELYRASKKDGGSFKNFKVVGTALKNWILSFVTVPPVSLQLQSKWSETDPTLVSYIQEKSTTTSVISLQALVGNFNPDVWYIIPNIQSGFGTLRIRARDANNLETKGTLIKNGLSYEVSYDLAGDSLTSLTDTVNLQFLNQFTGNTLIGLIPLDGTYVGNILTDGTYALSDVTKVSISDCTLYSCSVTLDDNGSTDPIGASINNVFSTGGGTINITGKSGGVKSQVTNVFLQTGSGIFAAGGSSMNGCVAVNNSTISTDDNGADGTTSASSLFVDGNTILSITGVSGGTGTVLSGCEITGMSASITIKGGETYEKKILNKSISTFNGSRVITADGAFSFIDSSLVANYNRSFIGIWTVTDVTGGHNIDSFTDRLLDFEHNVIFKRGAGGSTVTVKHDGVNIKLAGAADCPLATEGDFIILSYVGQVATEYFRMIQ